MGSLWHAAWVSERPVDPQPNHPQPNHPQPNNPLHGVTLAAILDYLVATIGWDAMARAVDIRCFTFEPSITSSLKFLRKVPWARAKVEELYLRTKARQSRSGG